MAKRLSLAMLALSACALNRPLIATSTHAARPVPSHSSKSSGHHSGSSGSLLADCLGILCDASACAIDAAASADTSESPPPTYGGYIDPPDPILVDAAAQPQAQPAAADPQPPQAVPAVAPSDAPLAGQLAQAIALAQDQLRSGERAAFVARFTTGADRAALEAQPGRDLVGELAGERSEQLLQQLDSCHTWGVQLEGEDATCGVPPGRMTWHLEPQGWAIVGLAAPATH